MQFASSAAYRGRARQLNMTPTEYRNPWVHVRPSCQLIYGLAREVGSTLMLANVDTVPHWRGEVMNPKHIVWRGVQACSASVALQRTLPAAMTCPPKVTRAGIYLWLGRFYQGMLACLFLRANYSDPQSLHFSHCRFATKSNFTALWCSRAPFT